MSRSIECNEGHTIACAGTQGRWQSCQSDAEHAFCSGHLREEREKALDEFEAKEQWLIWSNEHRAWWSPDHKGYTFSREEAGRYSYYDAVRIVRDANRHIEAGKPPYETMVLDQLK